MYCIAVPVAMGHSIFVTVYSTDQSPKAHQTVQDILERFRASLADYLQKNPKAIRHYTNKRHVNRREFDGIEVAIMFGGSGLPLPETHR